MSAQSKSVPGAGTTERQEDWSTATVISDYINDGTLSRRKRRYLADEMTRVLIHLGSYETHSTPWIAPSHICEALDLEPGSYWIQCGCRVLDTLKVPYYDNEDMPDVEDPWMHDICTILLNLEHVIGVMDDEGVIRKPHEIARVVESF